MTEPAAIPSDPRLDRQLAVLDRLAEIGLEIAEAIGAQVRSEEPFDAQAAAMAYARVARAVRQGVMLQSRLIADRPVPLREADRHPTPEDYAKDRVARIVHRVIEAEHDDEDRIERLQDEAIERLEDEDIHGAVLTRPMSEMVADICQDLGLHPDWTRLARECWAVEEIASGDVGEPLAAFARPPPLAGEGDREAVERAYGGDAFERPRSGSAPACPLGNALTAPPLAGEHAPRSVPLQASANP